MTAWALTLVHSAIHEHYNGWDQSKKWYICVSTSGDIVPCHICSSCISWSRDTKPVVFTNQRLNMSKMSEYFVIIFITKVINIMKCNFIDRAFSKLITDPLTEINMESLTNQSIRGKFSRHLPLQIPFSRNLDVLSFLTNNHIRNRDVILKISRTQWISIFLCNIIRINIDNKCTQIMQFCFVLTVCHLFLTSFNNIGWISTHRQLSRWNEKSEQTWEYLICCNYSHECLLLMNSNGLLEKKATHKIAIIQSNNYVFACKAVISIALLLVDETSWLYAAQ